MKLHEKKISQIIEIHDLNPDNKTFEYEQGKQYAVTSLKQWAIAVVKDYCERYNMIPFSDYGFTISKDGSTFICEEDGYVFSSLVDFLIDRFEITEEELK